MHPLGPWARLGAVALLIALLVLTTVSGRQPAPDLRPLEADWEPAGTRDGVRLAFRDDRAGGVREVRADAELPFPAARIAELVCDFRNYPELLPDVREARIVAEHGPGRYEIYMRYAPRFVIVAARDVVVQVQPREPPAAGRGCQWHEVSGSVAPSPGTVRMRQLRGRWTVDALDAVRARVTYEFAADPGGRIPKWMVRRGALGALPEVIAQVRRRLDAQSR
jgi:Polyketide cyclase / dehydrase and lipid transport